MASRSLQSAENAAFAIQRSLPQGEAGIPELLAMARRLISEAFDEAPDHEELDQDSWETHNRRKFDSAARVIRSLARRATESESTFSELTVLAAIAFSLDGNYSSGRLLATDVLAGAGSTEGLLVALGVGCPVVAIDCLNNATLSDLGKDILRKAHAAIALPDHGESDIVERIVAFQQRQPEPGLGYLLNLAITSIRRAITLRFDFILSDANFALKPQILSGLRKARRFLALPSQNVALLTDGLFEKGRPALVSLPTGAGKTLVGLLVLASSLAGENDVAVFLAPYLAIRRQVRAAAVDLFGKSVNMGTGDETNSGKRLPRLIIDTPEGFDATIRRQPELKSRIRAVVLDEAHLLGADARGVLSDGILTRLSLLPSQVARPKLILLSAVLDSDSNLTSWLNQDRQAAIARSRWRPAARRIGVWFGDGKLDWIRTLGSEGGNARALRIARGHIEPAYPHLSPGNIHFATTNRVRECDSNAALLATALWGEDKERTLLVVGSRARARSLARSIAARLSEAPEEQPHLSTVIEAIETRFTEFHDLVPLLRKRVSYHSAVLPYQLRHLIEEACAHGELDFVCSTTSLAEGADLPFGRTILADWTFPLGNGVHASFRPSLWRNIAGRCGRPSSHIEGETVVVFETPALAFVSGKQRLDALIAMLTGAVTLDFALAGDHRDHLAAREQLLHQTIAAIAENPGADDVHAHFVRKLLLARTGGEAQVHEAERLLEQRLLGGDDPLASRNSPLILTQKGLAVGSCPVLPDSADGLLRLLRENREIASDAELCELILLATANAAELEATRLASIARDETVRGLWIRPNDLREVCEQWLAGSPVRTILVMLAERGKRGTRRGRAELSEWAAGQNQSEEWVEVYEKLAEWCRAVLAEFLPRALAALALLAGRFESESHWTGELPRLYKRSLAAASQFREPDQQELKL